MLQSSELRASVVSIRSRLTQRSAARRCTSQMHCSTPRSTAELRLNPATPVLGPCCLSCRFRVLGRCFPGLRFNCAGAYGVTADNLDPPRFHFFTLGKINSQDPIIVLSRDM